MKPPEQPLKLLDIGCGEGRNAVFFARNGYNVTAFDISEKGIITEFQIDSTIQFFTTSHCDTVQISQASIKNIKSANIFPFLIS